MDIGKAKVTAIEPIGQSLMMVSQRCRIVA